MPTQDYSQQVQAAFTSLRNGLRPFVEQEMRAVYKERWLDECVQWAKVRRDREGDYTWDVMALLKVITNDVFWGKVFAMKKRRGAKEKGIFVTLLEWRHEYKAHDDKDVPKFDAQEVIESVIYALRCIGATEEVEASEELLKSLSPQPMPQPSEPLPPSQQEVHAVQDEVQPQLQNTPSNPEPKQSPAPVSKPTDGIEPAVTYNYSRLCFKADKIERLQPDEAFRVITPVGTFQMTKAQFYITFPKVVISNSYTQSGLYHFPTVPQRALPFKLPE